MWRKSAFVRIDLARLFNREEYQNLLSFLERLAEAMPPPKRKKARSHPRNARRLNA
jgi:hypothetical protein